MTDVTKPIKIYHSSENSSSHKLTIECIETTLFKLLKTKKFTDITITEIINKSGVSRMGFYRNYSSKEDIVEKMIMRNINQVIENIKKERSLNFDFSQIIKTSLENLKLHANEMKLLLDNNLSPLIFNIYQKAFLSLYNKNFKSNIREYYIMMFAGELFTLEITWLKNGLKESPAQMAKIYKKILKLKSN